MIGLALIAQLAMVANGPDSATACGTAQFSVAARAPGRIAPRIAIRGGAWVTVHAAWTSHVDSGPEPVAVTEGVVTMTPVRHGHLAGPRFVASAGSLIDSASTPALDVRGGADAEPVIVVNARLDRPDHRDLLREPLFVGEQVDYVVDVRLNEEARNRLRRNPTFFPPEMPGVLAYDLAAPTSTSRERGSCFQTLSYRRALFALFPGRTTIAPATLTYALPLSASFFSREESFEVRTDSVTLDAKDPPAMGRPVSYAGAVGSLSATLRVDATRARMGDPLVATVTLSGTGNVKLWPRPVLALSWASISAGDERVAIDSSGPTLRGTKDVELLLTPHAAGAQRIPSLEYVYFDPVRREYATALTAPVSVQIAPAALASVDTASLPRLPLVREFGTAVRRPLLDRSLFWLVLAVVPIPAAARRFGRARPPRARLAIDELTRRVRDTTLAPAALRRLMLAALSDRTGALAFDGTADGLIRALRRRGVTADTSRDAGALFAQLDAAAFSGTVTLPGDVAERVLSLLARVDAEAVRPASTSPLRLPLLLATLALVPILAASSDDLSAARSLFDRGVTRYDAGDAAGAQRIFLQATRRAPHVVALWRNAGTSAWSRGDTATAVRAWQRGMRLAPLNADLREQLSMAPGGIGSPGYLPPVPLDALAILAACCWLAAWTVLALPAARRPAQHRRIVSVAVTGAVVLLLGAMGFRERSRDSVLAVVREPVSVLAAPSVGELVGQSETGEVVRILAREGPWVRVALERRTTGWIPALALLPLRVPGEDN